MSRDDSDFRVRPGKVRHGRGPRAKPFVAQVLRAAQRAGHTGRAAHSRAGRSTFGRGRLAFAHDRLFSAQRRVVVAARIARHAGRAYRSAPLSTHLAYLKRDGVTRDGGMAVMFDAETDRADDRAFAGRSQDDRHHFRFIVSPEDAGELTDLRAFTRDLARQMESDLDTRLDWVAVDHWNTDNPHVHLLVRGVDDQGADLVMARDYISRGIRGRAEELVTIELGPKPEHEIRSSLERDVKAERWTRLDVEIRTLTDETGWIDLRPSGDRSTDPQTRRLMVGRLQHLERMGLAASELPGQWTVDLRAERALRDLGTRGDIIKTMHRAFADGGREHAIADFAIADATATAPIIGRLVKKGLHNELTGEAYAVIESIDGRAHHVRFRGIEALEHAPPAGGIVEVRRFGGPDDPRPTLVMATRSDFDLDRQVTAPGATWLDHRLVERDRLSLAHSGFGAEVREAMQARADHLAGQGLAQLQAGNLMLQPNLLATLRRQELDAATARLQAETGLTLVTATGTSVNGVYRRRLDLTSGRFAMIENGLGFRLVPWSRAIETKIGQHVSGSAKAGGGIDWSIGRQRSLVI